MIRKNALIVGLFLIVLTPIVNYFFRLFDILLTYLMPTLSNNRAWNLIIQG